MGSGDARDSGSVSRVGVKKTETEVIGPCFEGMAFCFVGRCNVCYRFILKMRWIENG